MLTPAFIVCENGYDNFHILETLKCMSINPQAWGKQSVEKVSILIVYMHCRTLRLTSSNLVRGRNNALQGEYCKIHQYMRRWRNIVEEALNTIDGSSGIALIPLFLWTGLTIPREWHAHSYVYTMPYTPVLCFSTFQFTGFKMEGLLH